MIFSIKTLSITKKLKPNKSIFCEYILEVYYMLFYKKPINLNVRLFKATLNLLIRRHSIEI